MNWWRVTFTVEGRVDRVVPIRFDEGQEGWTLVKGSTVEMARKNARKLRSERRLLHWLATDPAGHRWELYLVQGRRRVYVGRLLRLRPGVVSVGHFASFSVRGAPRWSEVTTTDLRSGAHVLVSIAKKKEPSS